MTGSKERFEMQHAYAAQVRSPQFRGPPQQVYLLYIRSGSSSIQELLYSKVLTMHILIIDIIDMHGQYFMQSMDQPGMAANPARVNFSTVPVRARELGLSRQVQPSRPALACSFFTLRPNLVLTHDIPPDFRDGVHIHHRPPSRQFQLEFIGSRNCVPMALMNYFDIGGRHCL